MAGWWRRTFQKTGLSGMQHSSPQTRACALDPGYRRLGSENRVEAKSARPRRAPCCLRVAHAVLPYVVVSGPQGHWVVAVSLLGDLKTNKKYVYI